MSEISVSAATLPRLVMRSALLLSYQLIFLAICARHYARLTIDGKSIMVNSNARK